jgi:carboxylesterase type B
VTIQGESAGASSVGYQLIAYGGRDDKLFRGAIMESGNPVYYGSMSGGGTYQPLFNQLAVNVSCNNTLDRLECLRKVPFSKLNAAINTTKLANAWSPAVDGDFIKQYGSLELKAGHFVRVPIIDGANSDEGLSFSAPGINTTADFRNIMLGAYPSVYVDEVVKAYPDIPSQGIPGSPPLGPLPPNFRFGPPLGAQERRAAAYGGDATFIAARRLTCETWAAAGLDASCYRFNALPGGVDYVYHFQEVAFAFLNLLGVGYVAPGVTKPFQGRGEPYRDLARLMDSSWVSFVHDGNPNTFRSVGSKYVKGFLNGSKPWPKYSLSNPQDYVFDANVSSHAEPDTWRKAGIDLINANAAGIYHR